MKIEISTLKRCIVLTACTLLIAGQSFAQNCQANFTFTTNGGTVTFTNTSTGSGFASYWNFGDGNDSWQTNPVHTYTSTGLYLVCLSISDSANCNSSYCDSLYVTVNQQNCTSSFYYVDNGGGNYDFVNTSTGAASARWFINFSMTYTTWNANHTFSQAGTYTVCLMTFDSAQQFCDSTCQNILVNPNNNTCTASFNTVDNGGDNYDFINTSTGASYSEWWIDGVMTYTTWNANHTFTQTGSHIVCLYTFDSMQTFCDTTCTNIFVTGMGDQLATNEVGIKNYPNPFGGSTTIEYAIAGNAEVEIFITDILGKRVATLVNEQQPSGTYKTDWVATGMENGIYILHVVMGEVYATGKMILNR